MRLIILASSPVLENTWEQGLELALNLAEMGEKCTVLLEHEFMYACAWNDPEADFMKKLGQLELMEVPVYAGTRLRAEWIKLCDSAGSARLMTEAEGILVF